MNVSVGPTSIVGWATFALAALATILIAVAEHSAELSGPGKWTAALALISFVVTHVGRYTQAPKAKTTTLIESNQLGKALAPPPADHQS